MEILHLRNLPLTYIGPNYLFLTWVTNCLKLVHVMEIRNKELNIHALFWNAHYWVYGHADLSLRPKGVQYILALRDVKSIVDDKENVQIPALSGPR